VGDKPPASAERTLLSQLTRLREALAGLEATARVERRGGGYLASIAPDALDVDRFERSLRQAPDLPATDAFNVSISPNGRYLSVSGFPPAVTLWDTRTYRRVAGPLPLDVDAVDARARFAPDGRLVVTSGPLLRSFVIDPAEWLARACREAGGP
jgi:hypothetical protein